MEEAETPAGQQNNKQTWKDVAKDIERSRKELLTKRAKEKSESLNKIGKIVNPSEPEKPNKLSLEERLKSAPPIVLDENSSLNKYL